MEKEFINDKCEGKAIYYSYNGDRKMGDYSDGNQIGKHVTLSYEGNVITEIF